MFFSFFFGLIKLFLSDILLTYSTIFFFFSNKVDFILNEAIEEDNEFKLVFTDDREGELFEKEDEGEELNFIDVVEEEPQDEYFYRKVDNQPLKFLNQTRYFNEVIQDSCEDLFKIFVKMICQNYLIQKIEKRLNLTFLRKINQNLVNLKIHSYNLKILIIHFFIRLFMNFFIIN